MLYYICLYPLFKRIFCAMIYTNQVRAGCTEELRGIDEEENNQIDAYRHYCHGPCRMQYQA